MRLAYLRRRRPNLGFWAAFEFLTILPSPLRRAFRVEEVWRSLPYFPVVGLLLGLLLWGLGAGLAMVFPVLLVSILVVAAETLITGAMHVDGFIDTCDGMAARRTVAQRLEIMKDSRVGAFGVIGGCLLLLTKTIALASVPAPLLSVALVSMPVLGRWTMLYAIFAYPYARGTEGTGYAFKQGATPLRFGVATAGVIGVAIMAARGWYGFALVAVVFLVSAGPAGYFRSRFGGLTGDNYGALNEMSEVVVLLALPVIWRLA